MSAPKPLPNAFLFSPGGTIEACEPSATDCLRARLDASVFTHQALAAVCAEGHALLVGVLHGRREKHHAAIVGTMREAADHPDLVDRFGHQPLERDFLAGFGGTTLG